MSDGSFPILNLQIVSTDGSFLTQKPSVVKHVLSGPIFCNRLFTQYQGEYEQEKASLCTQGNKTLQLI